MTPSLRGVHHACRLVRKLLGVFDGQLSNHLTGKVDPTIYAFAPCLSFLACLKPLDEVIRLWDLILPLGAHYCVVFYVTHLVLMRDLLLIETSPYR